MKQLYIKYLFLFFYINLPTFIDEEPIFNGIKYVWGLFWVVKALNSKSVYLVISCLKWLSLGLFISMLIVSIVLLYTLSKMIADYDGFVHEL